MLLKMSAQDTQCFYAWEKNSSVCVCGYVAYESTLISISYIIIFLLFKLHSFFCKKLARNSLLLLRDKKVSLCVKNLLIKYYK